MQNLSIQSKILYEPVQYLKFDWGGGGGVRKGEEGTRERVW